METRLLVSLVVVDAVYADTDADADTALKRKPTTIQDVRRI